MPQSSFPSQIDRTYEALCVRACGKLAYMRQRDGAHHGTSIPTHTLRLNYLPAFAPCPLDDCS